jgi:4-amino-4-deoxy-L-arabinose transferase-like glycosyltransferase
LTRILSRAGWLTPGEHRTNQEITVVSTALTPPLSPAEERPLPPDGTRPRHRYEIWRSPDGQPGWARPALLAVAALAAALYAWNIANAGLAPFYSVAVRSMSVSWKAFFYGALDPQATITIDKLAGSFLPQALSARIFGFHPWALALPQVIEGVVAVLVMYRVVRRWAGAEAGLLAALLFALTPIAASMFGHSMEDGALTMCLVLAADAWQRAAIEGRLRSLIWSGVWVGLGFQAKMLQAWMIVPALFIAYLIAAPPRLVTRLWQLAVAGVVMIAVSLSWIGLYTFTPAADRPYVDGSTNNSAFAMVFGYNGVERFGISFPGAVTSGPGVIVRSGSSVTFRAGGAGAFGGRGGFGGGANAFGTGWTKLLGSAYGPQIGWLYPLAVLALIAGLAWTLRARRDDPVRGGFLMWGSWLITIGFVFSAMQTIPHTAYMSSLAPPLAALSAAGIVMFWRLYRAGDRRGWLLPFAVLAEIGWAWFLWRDYRGFLPWALWAAIAVGVAAVVVLVAARLSRRNQLRVVVVSMAAGVAAMLAAPATWAGSVLDVNYAGTSFNATAGPAGAGGFGGGQGPVGRTSSRPFGEFEGAGFPGGEFPPGGFTGNGPGGPVDGPAQAEAGAPVPVELPGGGGGSSGGFGGPVANQVGGALGATTTLSSSEQAIYNYVSAHRNGASYLLAVSSWTEASPYILVTGQEVMPMGGFSGSVPEPTLARVQELVRTGQLRFFLVGGNGGFVGAGAGDSTSTVGTILAWVQSSCKAVTASAVGGSSSNLYECTPAS